MRNGSHSNSHNNLPSRLTPCASAAREPGRRRFENQNDNEPMMPRVHRAKRVGCKRRLGLLPRMENVPLTLELALASKRHLVLRLRRAPCLRGQLANPSAASPHAVEAFSFSDSRLLAYRCASAACAERSRAHVGWTRGLARLCGGASLTCFPKWLL